MFIVLLLLTLNFTLFMTTFSATAHVKSFIKLAVHSFKIIIIYRELLRYCLTVNLPSDSTNLQH